MVQMIPNKVYVRLYGGMGDFFKRYLTHCTWQCLEDFKAKNPQVSIRALLVSQTTPALKLVDYHSCIDEVVLPHMHPREFRKMDIAKYMDGYVPLRNNLAKQYELKTPPFYLSNEDENFIKQTTAHLKKYIVLHPFAGDKYSLNSRTPLKPKQYIPIIKALTKKGYKVLLLGGSWQRIHEKQTRVIQEKFDWKIDGLINLINKTNVRTGAELVKRADGFVGTASSFMCAAWSLEKRSVVLISSRWKKPLETTPWAKNRGKQSQNHIVYLPKKRTPQVYRDMTEQTAEWFK